MIRKNLISRDAGMKRIENDNVIDTEYISEFLKEININFNQVQNALDKYQYKAHS